MNIYECKIKLEKIVREIRDSGFDFEYFISSDENERVKEGLYISDGIDTEFIELNSHCNKLQEDKIKKYVAKLEKSPDGLRNKTMFLILLTFGLKRSKLCSLKWGQDFVVENGRILYRGKFFIPSYLEECLLELKIQSHSEYVLYDQNTETQMKTEHITNILSNLSKSIDFKDDEYYKELSPENIRKSVFDYLFLNEGYELADLMYWMDIKVDQLCTFIDKNKLNNKVEKVKNSILEYKRIDESIPMNAFLEKLRE